MDLEGAHELVRRCAVQRDAGAWGEFRDRFERRLIAGVRRGLRRTGLKRPPVEVEDLLQEVYCRLLDNQGRNLLRCRGRGEAAISAYLGKVAESVAIDRVRAEVAVKRGRGRVVSLWMDGDFDPAQMALDSGASPEEMVLRRERRRIFLERCREAVGPRTPRRDLRVLYLAYIEGLSSREIAEVMGKGLTPSSVDSLVHRARQRLARLGLGVPVRRHPPSNPRNRWELAMAGD